MGRPRKVSDEQVYEAAIRVMSRVGPADFTLAAIAEEAGVTSGALVQRFGSRQELLRTLASGLGSDMRAFFRDTREKERGAVATIRTYAACMADMAKTPAALLRNFAYLQDDLADPELRARLVDQSKVVRAELAKLVREAIALRELRKDTDVAPLVANIEALVSGALLTWAFHRKGSARTWLLEHVDALIAPHRY
jgi:AcrR family transcriptional regulator